MKPPILFKRMPGVTDYSEPANRIARADQKLHDKVKHLPGYQAFRREQAAGNPVAEELWLRLKKSQTKRVNPRLGQKFVRGLKRRYPWETDPEKSARRAAEILGEL